MLTKPFIEQLIAWIFPPVCAGCGREGAWLCAAARARLAREPTDTHMIIPGLEQVIARGSYDCPPLKAIIQRLKYAGWFGLHQELQTIIRPVVERLQAWPAETMIVPVPLHRRREQSRGFNQSDYVARALSSITGWAVVHCLRRARATKTQAQLSANERSINVAGAFRFSGRGRAAQRIILVDDVITTGSTIFACAEVLRQNGAQHIAAVALAKG